MKGRLWDLNYGWKVGQALLCRPTVGGKFCLVSVAGGRMNKFISMGDYSWERFRSVKNKMTLNSC